MNEHERNQDVISTGAPEKRLPQPKHLLIVTAISVFLGEVVVMLILAALPPMPTFVEALADGVMITILATPFLYLFLFRPMQEHVRSRTKAEQDLRALNDSLEHLVAERTAGLELANRELSAEIVKHHTTADSLRRSNAFIEQMVERAPCLMLTFDADSLRCIYVNDRVTEILGYSQDSISLVRETLLEGFVAPDQRAEFREVVRAITVGPEGEVARGTCGFMSSNGEVVDLRYGLTVLNRSATMEAKDLLLTAMPANV